MDYAQLIKDTLSESEDNVPGITLELYEDFVRDEGLQYRFLQYITSPAIPYCEECQSPSDCHRQWCIHAQTPGAI